MCVRIGHGYDVHKLVENRKLILGGVTIPYEKGLLGHSDADVLVHSIIDAMLGAAAKGDIGAHFPDTDPKYKDISSINLLGNVWNMLKSDGFSVGNIDCTILAQAPKLRPYIEQITTVIAETLSISKSQINFKATTEEGLGFTGQGLGIACHCVILLTTD